MKTSRLASLTIHGIFKFAISFATTALLAHSASAQIDIVNGAVAHANGAALANPPLPILFNKKGAKKFSIQPGYLVVDGSADEDIKELDYSGYGLSTLFNHMLTDRFGYYIMASITQISGDITAPGSNSSGQIRSSDINSFLYMASAGVTYTLISSKWLTIPVFAGPSLIGGKVEATYVHTNDSNTVLDDFDAESSPSLTGITAGVQVGIHLSKHFTLNPYFVYTRSLSEDTCQDFEATAVRVSGGLFDQSGPGCQENNNQSQFEFDPFVQSFGLNVLFPSIGLSVNAYSESGDVPLFDGTKIRVFFVSWSMGTP